MAKVSTYPQRSLTQVLGVDEAGNVGLAAHSYSGLCKFGPVMGRKLYRPGGNLGGANTIRIQWALEAGFSQVALVFANYTASAQTVDKAAVAVSNAVGNGYTPSGGDASSWVAVTFAGGSASGTIPASSGAGALATHGLLVSDWITLSSLARVDGGALPLLLTACYTSTGTMSVCQPTAPEIAAYNAAANNRLVTAYLKGGDQITTPTGFTSPTGPTKFLAPIGVIVRSDVRGLSVLACGDSTFQGAGSTISYGGWIKGACEALTATSRPVSWINGGFSGLTTPWIQTNAKAQITAFKPDAVFIQTWSTNDGNSQALADAGWARAMDVADHAITNQCVPILCTPMPCLVGTDSYRRGVADKVRNSGYLYADFDAVLRDGADPSRLISGYNSGDGVHPNDAGYAVCAAVAQAALSKILAAMPAR